MRAADHGVAVDSYRRALESMALEPTADNGDRLAVTIDLGHAMMLSGQRDGESMLRNAVHAARRRGDPVAAAAAMTAMTNTAVFRVHFTSSPITSGVMLSNTGPHR